MIHGGAIAALADITVMAVAWLGAPLPQRMRGVTTSMDIEFVAPAWAVQIPRSGCPAFVKEGLVDVCPDRLFRSAAHADRLQAKVTSSQPSDTFAARATLSRPEKLAFARQAVTAQLVSLPGIVLAEMGLGTRDTALHLHAEPPDSKCARQATELAEEAYDTELFNHCLRSWCFADLFAQIERQHYDPELLYVACVMHDLALTDGHRPTRQDVPCFAVHGGHLAAEALQSWGATNQTTHAVAHAIAAHMDVSVQISQGIEAHLLHAAAQLDVAGTQIRGIPRWLIKQVVERYPRGQFTTRFIEAMRREAHDHPNSRTAVFWKLGVQLPIKLNPIETFD